MQKFPFSPTGLQELLGQLYQLPDSKLSAEAASAAADLRNWLSERFELEQSQLNYLNLLDTQFIADAAEQVRYFMASRKPIQLIKQEPSQLDQSRDEPADKIVVVNGDKKSSYSPQQGYSADESLNFTILYQQAG